jgi:hypothetical protein
MGFKQFKGEHQVRYDGGMTPDKPTLTGSNQTAD